MKVAILSESFLMGGLETRLKSIAKYITRQGYEVYLLTQNFDNKAHSNLPFKGIRVVNFNDVRTVKEALNELSPDIADIHPFSSIASGAEACLELGIPYSITIHGVYMQRNYVPYLQNADHVIAVSEEVRTQILRYVPSLKITILKNGVDLEAFKPVNASSQFNVAYISRLDNNKISGILHASSLIKQKQNAKLCLLGNGASENKLKQMLPSCEFYGYIEDIASYFQKNDSVYSAIGGMGRTVVEGMAMKMPVIVMSYDGVKGYVTPFNFSDFAKNNFSGRGMPNIESLPDIDNDYTETLYQIVCNEYDINKIAKDYIAVMLNKNK